MQTESIQRAPALRWTKWLAFLLIGLFNYLLTALGASAERLRQDLGVSRSVVGLHATCFAAGIVVAGLAGDRLSRRFGRPPVVAAGAAGMAAAALLVALSHRPALTLAGAFAMGASGSLLLVLLPALLADLHAGRSGAILGQANALSSLFAAAAPFVVGTAVALSFGWRWALVLGSVALLVAGAAFWRTSGGLSGAAPTGLPMAVLEGRRLPLQYWPWWATLVLVVCVEFSFVFWTADELRTVASLPPAVAAGAITVFELALTGGRLAGSQALRRTGSLPLLRTGLITAALGFVLFWSARSGWAGLAGLGVAGLGVAMLYPIALAGAISASGGRSDLGSARAAVGSGLAIGLAPFGLGLLADAHGVHAAYLVVPLLLAAAWASSGVSARRGGRRPGAPASAGSAP